MIRQKVLDQWNDFKKKLLDDNKLLAELSSNLENMTASGSGSGCGIKASSYQVMEELKRRLPSITQRWRELSNKYVSRQFGQDQLILSVFSTYLSYIGLVETYQKIVEYYDDSQDKGPTIEIVD